MSERYMGEIRWFAFSRVPQGWQPCDGRLLAVAPNQALFSLLGVSYGGDGQTTFGLPDLRGRVALHRGQAYGLSPRALGNIGGSETVTLTELQMPAHVHLPAATAAAANQTTPAGNTLATLPASDAMYVTNTAGLTPVPLRADTLGTSGASAPHPNLAPTLTLMPCIATTGDFPPRP